MKSEMGAQIIEKARRMGATMAGIASVELLKKSPSNEILSIFGTKVDGVHSSERAKDFKEIKWPLNAKSALVLAISHPQDKPEMDWSYSSGNTPGNQLLVNITKELSAWIEETLVIKVHRMPYFIEEGGIFLKDAAVLAGLGCIGKNNILITPEFGSRVRFRAILLEAKLASTGPINYDPCDGCDEYCRKACPQNAFDRTILTPLETGINALPGRDGRFSRSRCSIQMGLDIQNSGVIIEEGFMSELYPRSNNTERLSQTTERIKWCRICELVCPVGSL